MTQQSVLSALRALSQPLFMSTPLLILLPTLPAMAWPANSPLEERRADDPSVPVNGHERASTLTQVVATDVPIPIETQLLSEVIFESFDPGNTERVDANLPTVALGTRAYTPPDNSRVSGGNHTSGGIRGGCMNRTATLAPKVNFIGQTAAARPTFTWFTYGDYPSPMTFELWQYQADGSREPIYQQAIGESHQGFMTHTVPVGETALESGLYHWRVTLYCDAALTTYVFHSSADMEVVERPAILPDALPSDTVEQAQVLAAAGLWFEAIALVADGATPAAQAFRETLLLDLAAYEEDTNATTESASSREFREIATLSAPAE